MYKGTANQMSNTNNIVIIGLMAAIITVSTMIISIPLPIGGYIHLGDSMVILGALLLGRRRGVIAAAIGMAVADILVGWAIYAGASAIIKGLMAYVIASIVNEDKDNMIKLVGASIVGGVIMIGGYFIFESLLYQDVIYASASIVPNLIQATGGIIIALALYPTLKRVIKVK